MRPNQFRKVSVDNLKPQTNINFVSWDQIRNKESDYKLGTDKNIQVPIQPMSLDAIFSAVNERVPRFRSKKSLFGNPFPFISDFPLS